MTDNIFENGDLSSFRMRCFKLKFSKMLRKGYIIKEPLHQHVKPSVCISSHGLCYVASHLTFGLEVIQNHARIVQ